MQGVLVPEFKVAQDFEIVLAKLEEGFTNQIIRLVGSNPSGVASDASPDRAGDYGLKATPEFDPQFGA
jgi:hypothetical protein